MIDSSATCVCLSLALLRSICVCQKGQPKYVSHLSRRNFMKLSALLGSTSVMARAGVSIGRSPAIMKITILQVPGDFARPVAMNAYDTRPVGKNGAIRMIKIHLSDGTVGIGVEG